MHYLESFLSHYNKTAMEIPRLMQSIYSVIISGGKVLHLTDFLHYKISSFILSLFRTISRKSYRTPRFVSAPREPC